MLRAAAIAALVPSMAVLIGFAHVDSHSGPTASTASPAPHVPEPQGLADGDLVFRTGRDMVARLVLSQGESPRFSHVGVIVKQDGKPFVVHALPKGDTARDGVRIEPLSLFASNENTADIGYYRIKGIDTMVRQEIRSYALHQIGKPFDDVFKFSDDTQFYCTELVLKALAAGGLDLSESILNIHVFMLAEPVFPPDHLRRSSKLEAMTVNPPLQ
jgi:hypothetical protein